MNFPTVCLPSQISGCRWQYLDISLPTYMSGSTETWSWQLWAKCCLLAFLGNSTMSKHKHTSAVSEAALGDLHHLHTLGAGREAGGSRNVISLVLPPWDLVLVGLSSDFQCHSFTSGCWKWILLSYHIFTSHVQLFFSVVKHFSLDMATFVPRSSLCLTLLLHNSSCFVNP